MEYSIRTKVWEAKTNNNFTASRSEAPGASVIGYLSVSLQRREVEEERLSQRNAVDGVVQVVAPVQLHLEGGGRDFNKTRQCLERTNGNYLLIVLTDIQETCGHFR